MPRAALIAAVSAACVLAGVAAAALFARPPRALHEDAAPSASIAVVAPIATAAPTVRNDESPGHLEGGQIASTIDVPADAIDVHPLPGDRIGVARRGAMEVIDAKSGAIAFSTAELGGVRALFGVSGAIYAIVGSRVAVLDPDRLHVLRWLEMKSAPASVVGARGAERQAPGVALLIGAADRSIGVIDIAQHAELERFRFDERLTAVALDRGGRLAAGVSGDPGAIRSDDDAITVFEPRRFASAQAIRRVYVGEGAVDVAILRGEPEAPGAAVVALRRSSEIARVPLDPAKPLYAMVTRQKTCEEPEHIDVATSAILVACRGGRSVAIHDPETLALRETLSVGGPALGMEVSPNGLQALVVVGAPAPGIAVVDVVRRESRRVSVPDELTAVRYERGGRMATAFASKRHRVWVLR
jgi:hypothetical protein